MGSGHPFSHDVVAEQQARCYELHLAGTSVRRIAAQMGLSFGTVHKRIRAQAALAEQQGTTP